MMRGAALRDGIGALQPGHSTVQADAQQWDCNLLSIAVLYRRDMDLKPIFRQILIALITFDFFFIVFNLVLFSIPHFSIQYDKQVFPYLVPYVLPLAQIAQTGS